MNTNIKSIIKLCCVVFAFTFGTMTQLSAAKDSSIIASYVPSVQSLAMIASDPALIEKKLNDAMRKLLNNPASLTIQLESYSFEESSKGHYKKVYVHTSGGKIENLRLEKADIYFDDVQLNLEKLLQKEQIDPVSMKKINMNIVLSEVDMNVFIKAKSKSIKVRKPRVRMRPGKIELSGIAKYGLVKVKFWASGGFTIKNSTEIWFFAKRMKINYLSMPRSFVGMIVKRINPILKLDKFPFKLDLKEIRIDKGKMTFTTFEKGKIK